MNNKEDLNNHEEVQNSLYLNDKTNRTELVYLML